MNGIVPLGGTSNHIRTAVLCALGGWDAYNVTEDCDLGLRLARFGLKTVILESTTYEEATSGLRNLLRQRSRWIKGYMQTYLVHMRSPWKTLKQMGLPKFFSLQIFLGASVGMLFLNPLMWYLLGIYIVAGNHLLEVYHRLFPASILYISMLTFFGGTIFYIYLYLLGCAKQKQYHLLPWALLMHFYWALNVIAAVMAFYELMVSPHYWQKTMHGFHLSAQKEEVDLPLRRKTAHTAEVAELLMEQKPIEAKVIPSITSEIRKVSVNSNSVSTLYLTYKKTYPLIYDHMLIATILTACISNIASCLYYFAQHQTLLYADAYAHLYLARSVFDSLTPGFAQLGSIWLPLPHLLMLPLIWHDELWHSGLAGSFVSICCSIIAACYLYLSVRRLTGNRFVSYIGVLLFLFNVNILYLQTTPLSELVCICTSTAACYYFLAWAQDQRLVQLLSVAAATFLAAISRYDGWALFVVLTLLVMLVSWCKKYSWARIRGNMILFVLLACSGIILWLLWNYMLNGDPLSFQHGKFSSQAMQLRAIEAGFSLTYHHPWMALKVYTLNVVDTVGPILCVLAALGLLLYCWQNRFSRSAIALFAFITPFPFYVFSLYSGQATIIIPEAAPEHINPLYNVRYGSAMVVPIALFAALFIAQGYHCLRNLAPIYRRVGQFVLVGVIIVQVPILYAQPAIALRDGLNGMSCAPTYLVNIYLAQHYAGGRILQDITAADGTIADAGIDFKQVIYDGSGQIWRQALAHPEQYASWILINSKNPLDLVDTYRKTKNPALLSHYQLVFLESNGLQLYLRNGEPPLPTRSVPSHLFTDHQSCDRVYR